VAKEINLTQLAIILLDASKDVEDVAEQALNVSAEDLLSDSKELAPLDEGGLRENGSVEPAQKQGDEIVAKVGYSKEYALRMHEDYYNPQHAGTGRKYLEKPTRKNGQKYADYLAEKMGEVFDE